MIEITNRVNIIEITFNQYAIAFAASKVAIEKGSGNRLYLSPDESYIEIIYSADGEKVAINQGQYAVFDSGGGIAFASMEDLYDRLAEYMNDRTGGL